MGRGRRARSRPASPAMDVQAPADRIDIRGGRGIRLAAQRIDGGTVTSTSSSLRLLGGFDLVCDGASVSLPMSAQRLLAFLALHDRPLQRTFVAGSLWLDSPEERAYGNLRTALWRLHRGGFDSVQATGQQLSLGPSVTVDLRLAESVARRALNASGAFDVEVDP